MKMITLYGSNGQIGRLLGRHWSGHVDLVEEGDPARVTETVVWCATRPPPLEVLRPRIEELADFLAVLEACEAHGTTQLVFTSTFGVELGEGTWSRHYYGAGKLAGEAFVEA